MNFSVHCKPIACAMIFLEFVGLVLSITLRPIPITALQSAALDTGKRNQQQKETSTHNRATTGYPKKLLDRPITIDGNSRIVTEPKAKDDAKESAGKAQGYWNKAFEPQSLSQWMLAIFALGAIIFSFAAFIQSQRTLRLAHRPKMIVRNVVIHGLEKLNRHTPMNQWSADLTGYYIVANIGGIASTIQEVFEGAWINKDLPMERPDRTNIGRQVNTSLRPGESKEINIGHIVLSGDDACDLIDGKSTAYFLVRIKYIDSGKIIRETSGCRKFDPAAKYFVRVDNPDYEYAD